MKTDDLILFTKAYDLTLWMMSHTAKFPKSSRFSISVRMENRLLDLVSAVLRANRAEDRRPLLKEADSALEEARILLRMSKDLRFISLSSYEFGARSMDELGRMLGAWLRREAKV